MRAFLRGSCAVAAILMAGLLFICVDGVSYTVQGTKGSLHSVSLIMSTIYTLVFLLAPVWFGYRRWMSCAIAYGVLLTAVSAMGLMGYLGYGFLLGGLSSVYFLLITPFAAIIEAIALSWHLYDAADTIMLLVPVAMYCLALLAYLAGKVLRTHRHALCKTFVRLDSRYVYQMPVEETVEGRHTA